MKLLLLFFAVLLTTPWAAKAATLRATTSATTQGEWSVNETGQAGTVQRQLVISYGQGTSFPQYAVLHLQSSYFRMVPDAESASWGTSIIVSPSYWTADRAYRQGASLSNVSWEIANNNDLVLSAVGHMEHLQFTGEIRIQAPSSNNNNNNNNKAAAMQAWVSVTITAMDNALELQQRPHEAFKPVMLSSMHIGATQQWDAESAFVADNNDNNVYEIPERAWIIRPSSVAATGDAATEWGLAGGTSTWKANAPTVAIDRLTYESDEDGNGNGNNNNNNNSFSVQGWVTPTDNPNHDNVGFWAATDRVLSSWTYRITVASTAEMP